jgi:hypothetical protein
MIQYLVYPVTGALPAETTNTEAQLNEICGAANVSPVRHLNGQSTEIFDYWTVTVLQNSDLAERIRNLDGIDRVEQATTPEALTADSEHHKLVRRDVQRYIAIAKTNSDLQETEKFLKSKLQKGSSLLDVKANNKTIGWHGFMLDHEAFLEVKNYEGIEAIEIDGKLVDFYPPAGGDRADPAQPISGVERRSEEHDNTQSSASGVLPSQIEHPDLSRRDIGKYAVVATNISDLKAVEDFLRSKVQSGTEFRPFPQNNNDIAVWYSVMLDKEAKTEVEKFEGIHSVEVGEQGVFFRVLPLSHDADEAQTKHKSLLSRDIQWTKQSNADKALVMDSQYE